MSTANTSLNLIDLDFDPQKAALRNFMQTQTVFKDYDFSGANINVLLDILTNNTQKNLFFLSMAISEGFIDSAQLKNTIFSHAKELNYLPVSAQSSKATVTCKFTATGETQPYIIQKGQSFSSLVKNNSLVFSIPETLTVFSANTTYQFTTDIYEGIYVKDSYVYNNTSTPFPTFKITNQNVDLSSLVVTIYENNNVIGNTYLYTTTLLGLTGSSQVFFIQTNVADGNYEVLFGDGVCGQQPLNNAVIVLDYRISSGILGNGASTFALNFDPTSSGQLTSSPTITTNSNSIGGMPQQSIESVRFYAPRAFEVQQRCVVPSDYKVLLQTQFPEIQAINVYGGETLTPPQFGKVVIAVAINNVTGLPTSKINQYASFLQSRNMLTITPIWVTPQFIYVQVNSTIRYNINVSNETPNRISTLVSAAVSQFNTTNLNDFDVTLRYSQLTTAIDDSDISIVSNITDLQLYFKLIASTSIATNYILNFAVPLIDDLPMLLATHPSTNEKVLSSSTFLYKGSDSQLEDDGNGNVRIVQINQNSLTAVQNVGKINYATGLVTLSAFLPDSYVGNALLVFVRPKDNDVSCSQNTILTIEPSQINLTIQQLNS